MCETPIITHNSCPDDCLTQFSPVYSVVAKGGGLIYIYRYLLYQVQDGAISNYVMLFNLLQWWIMINVANDKCSN